jgi:hypothetical protein
MKAVPCEDIVSSNLGGEEDALVHNRTVASLDADMTALVEGNTTARTY